MKLLKVSVVLSALLALGAFSSPAVANSYDLICENPRQEYRVQYTDGDDQIRLESPKGTTFYRVLAVEKTEDRHVVVALTPGGGPIARLSFRPYLRFEFWSGSELFQTDACRAP